MNRKVEWEVSSSMSIRWISSHWTYMNDVAGDVTLICMGISSMILIIWPTMRTLWYFSSIMWKMSRCYVARPRLLRSHRSTMNKVSGNVVGHQSTLNDEGKANHTRSFPHRRTSRSRFFHINFHRLKTEHCVSMCIAAMTMRFLLIRELHWCIGCYAPRLKGAAFLCICIFTRRLSETWPLTIHRTVVQHWTIRIRKSRSRRCIPATNTRVLAISKVIYLSIFRAVSLSLINTFKRRVLSIENALNVFWGGRDRRGLRFKQYGFWCLVLDCRCRIKTYSSCGTPAEQRTTTFLTHCLCNALLRWPRSLN